MGHEGIKFSQSNDPELAQNRMRLEPDAITPKAVRVHLAEGTGTDIDWKDGHSCRYSFKWLRDFCPCALCNEQREQREKQAQPPTPAVLPMFKAPPRPEEVIPVGKYAISFRWNDGHQHGIYSWEYLRQNCQCNACKIG